MDFIARFENLESDFLKIAQAIGFKDSGLPKKQYTGESNSYVNAYNSTTKDIIWTRYKEEINFFGFEFGE